MTVVGGASMLLAVIASDSVAIQGFELWGKPLVKEFRGKHSVQGAQASLSP